MEVRVELDAATFMDSPAVKWAMTFKRKATVCDTLQDLANGVFLNEFMADIDPTNFARSLRQIRDPMSMAADDCGRHNLNLLLEGITNYYQVCRPCLVDSPYPPFRSLTRCDGWPHPYIAMLTRCTAVGTRTFCKPC